MYEYLVYDFVIIKIRVGLHTLFRVVTYLYVLYWTKYDT